MVRKHSTRNVQIATSNPSLWIPDKLVLVKTGKFIEMVDLRSTLEYKILIDGIKVYG